MTSHVVKSLLVTAQLGALSLLFKAREEEVGLICLIAYQPDTGAQHRLHNTCRAQLVDQIVVLIAIKPFNATLSALQTS